LKHIHDFHEAEKNSLDILSKQKKNLSSYNIKSIISFFVELYKQVINKLFQVIVYHDQHNRQETDNSIQVEIHHIQINVINPYIAHEYHLMKHQKIQHNFIREFLFIPQILSGASSSNKIGWLRNISRDFKHRPRTSPSVI
jgi:hypothetical protein